jgi:hypothetical protein
VIPVALALTYVELELVDEGLESVDDAVCPAAKGNTARVRSVITNALAKQVGIGPNVMCILNVTSPWLEDCVWFVINSFVRQARRLVALPVDFDTT